MDFFKKKTSHQRRENPGTYDLLVFGVGMAKIGGYDGVGGFAITFCVLGKMWKKQVLVLDFYDLMQIWSVRSST